MHLPACLCVSASGELHCPRPTVPAFLKAVTMHVDHEQRLDAFTYGPKHLDCNCLTVLSLSHNVGPC